MLCRLPFTGLVEPWLNLTLRDSAFFPLHKFIVTKLYRKWLYVSLHEGSTLPFMLIPMTINRAAFRVEKKHIISAVHM